MVSQRTIDAVPRMIKLNLFIVSHIDYYGKLAYGGRRHDDNVHTGPGTIGLSICPRKRIVMEFIVKTSILWI